MSYKCIIFDCDGVLVDSEPLGNQTLVDMANELGANITLDYAYQHFKGNSLHRCINQISNLISVELPKKFESEYRRRSFETFKNYVKPVEGVLDVVKNLDILFLSHPVDQKIKFNSISN